MQIKDKQTGAILVKYAEYAHTFLQKLIGLMFQKHISDSYGLVFLHVSCIHTSFMRVPIDIVFFDKNNTVVRICSIVKPWKIKYCYKAYGVVEVSAGTAMGTFTNNQVLEFINKPST